MKDSSLAVLLTALALVVAAVFLDMSGFSAETYNKLVQQEVPKPTGTIFEEYTRSISGSVISLQGNDFYLRYADPLTETYKTAHILTGDETLFVITNTGKRGSLDDVMIGSEVMVWIRETKPDGSIVASSVDIFG